MWFAPNIFENCLTGIFPYLSTVSLAPFLTWALSHWHLYLNQHCPRDTSPYVTHMCTCNCATFFNKIWIDPTWLVGGNSLLLRSCHHCTVEAWPGLLHFVWQHGHVLVVVIVVGLHKVKEIYDCTGAAQLHFNKLSQLLSNFKRAKQDNCMCAGKSCIMWKKLRTLDTFSLFQGAERSCLFVKTELKSFWWILWQQSTTPAIPKIGHT